MGKKLFYLRNFLFVVVVALLVGYFSNLIDLTTTYSLSLYLVLGMLAITYINEFVQKNNNFNYHLVYNGAAVLGFIYILVAMLKGIVEHCVVVEAFVTEPSGVKVLANIYFARTCPFIVLVLLILLVYTVVLNRQLKQK